MTARQTAFLALRRIAGGAYSGIALDAVLNGSQLSDRDRALATTLVYGVLERELSLDAEIGKRLRDSGAKLEDDVRIILRMGMYQLICMDKIPTSAAVNTSVELAKSNGLYRASGFVNGVLRGFVRDMEKSGKSSGFTDDTSPVCPDWLTELWTSSYGEALCTEIAASISGRAPVFARVNNTKNSVATCVERLSSEGVKANAVTSISGAVELSGTGDIEAIRSYQKGMFHIQDISSQFCCSVLTPEKRETVLDVCAAPGGKAFTLSEIMCDTGHVIACDLYESRVRLIALGAERLGLKSVKPMVRDAACGNVIEADKVLCDVPCSGLGIIRRKPDIMKKSAEDIAGLAEIQLSILRRSAECVKPGGTLVYSTCTLNPAENGCVVAAFLESDDRFEPFDIELPDEIERRITEPAHTLTMFPSKNGGDGFFVARMRRKI